MNIVIIVLFNLLFILVYVSVISFFMRMEQKDIDRCNENVMGVITQKLFIPGNSNMKMKIKYTVDGHTYEAIYGLIPAMKDKFEIGQEIEVWYNPDIPEHIVIREIPWHEYTKKSFFYLGLALFIGIFFMSIILTVALSF